MGLQGSNGSPLIKRARRRFVFTGLAINTSPTDIYAANFSSTGGIDEFSSNWSPVSLSGSAFKDPSLASCLEPYNIQDINGRL